MKYLFVHDHVLHKLGNDYYSTGGLSNNVMYRYLYDNNSELIVYSRQVDGHNDDINKLVKVNDNRIICQPTKLYHSPKDYLKKRTIITREIRPLIEQVDFVIIRIPSFLGFFAYEETLRQGKKYILEMVACPWDSLWNHSSVFGKFLAPIMYYKTKKVCKNADKIVYVTSEFLQKRYPTRGDSISCSNVNLLSIDEDVLKKRLMKIKKYDSKKTKIGLIGSLNVNFKGHREAINMAKILKSRGHDVEVHFLGAGDKERWFKYAQKKDVVDNIFFDGTLPSGEPVLEWLDDLDIFIIPSLQEGLPRALIEAMSRACPAVGMHTGGIPELIDKNFICKKRDYASLANKVEILINDKKIMSNLAKSNFENSKRYIKEKLDNDRKEFITKIILSD